MENPFYFNGEASEFAFLKRDKDEALVRQWVRQRMKVRLDGERRIGKTTLIKSALKDTPTVFVDLSAVKSESAVVDAVRKAVKKLNDQSLFSKTRKALISHDSLTVKLGMLGEWGFNISNSPFSNQIEELKVLLDGINDLSKKTPHCIVFDEFQELLYLPDPNKFMWSIRSIIQKHSNVAYIFCGSNRRELIQIFDDAKAAFFKQTLHYTLNSIERANIEPWYKNQFRKGKMEIDPMVTEQIWNITTGITGDVQKLCYFIWKNSSKNIIGLDVLHSALKDLFRSDKAANDGILRGLTAKQQLVLRALAITGGNAPYGSEVLRLSGVGSGTVRSSISALIDSLVVFETDDKCIKFNDPFFRMFLQNS